MAARLSSLLRWLRAPLGSPPPSSPGHHLPNPRSSPQAPPESLISRLASSPHVIDATDIDLQLPSCTTDRLHSVPSRKIQQPIALGTLIGHELRNRKLERPTVKFCHAALAKKGEDYFLVKPDCQRFLGNPSTSFSIFLGRHGHAFLFSYAMNISVRPKEDR